MLFDYPFLKKKAEKDGGERVWEKDLTLPVMSYFLKKKRFETRMAK